MDSFGQKKGLLWWKRKGKDTTYQFCGHSTCAAKQRRSRESNVNSSREVRAPTVEEARERVTDYRGDALDLKGWDVLVSNGLLHLEYTNSTPPTQTTANSCECFRRQTSDVAGISEQQRTTTTLRNRLCTAEVGGSNPLGSTPKMAVLQDKVELKMSMLTAGGPLMQQPILQRVFQGTLRAVVFEPGPCCRGRETGSLYRSA
jgi:hypothetical protein